MNSFEKRIQDGEIKSDVKNNKNCNADERTLNDWPLHSGDKDLLHQCVWMLMPASTAQSVDPSAIYWRHRELIDKQKRKKEIKYITIWDAKVRHTWSISSQICHFKQLWWFGFYVSVTFRSWVYFSWIAMIVMLVSYTPAWTLIHHHNNSADLNL